jgi:hypothetical protein
MTLKFLFAEMIAHQLISIYFYETDTTEERFLITVKIVAKSVIDCG